jgi:hypothetical protein
VSGGRNVAAERGQFWLGVDSFARESFGNRVNSPSQRALSMPRRVRPQPMWVRFGLHAVEVLVVLGIPRTWCQARAKAARWQCRRRRDGALCSLVCGRGFVHDVAKDRYAELVGRIGPGPWPERASTTQGLTNYSGPVMVRSGPTTTKCQPTRDAPASPYPHKRGQGHDRAEHTGRRGESAT